MPRLRRRGHKVRGYAPNSREAALEAYPSNPFFVFDDDPPTLRGLSPEDKAWCLEEADRINGEKRERQRRETVFHRLATNPRKDWWWIRISDPELVEEYERLHPDPNAGTEAPADNKIISMKSGTR